MFFVAMKKSVKKCLLLIFFLLQKNTCREIATRDYNSDLLNV
jgi:hypothetical protein